VRHQSAIDQARELHRRGVRSYDRGRPSAAAAQFRRALSGLGASAAVTHLVGPRMAEPERPAPGSPAPVESAERQELVTRLLISLALSEADISHVDRGLAILNEAAALAADSPELSVLVRGQKALLLLRAGRGSQALALFDSAVELLDHADIADRCRILLNRGVLLLDKDLDRAADDLRRSVELARAGGFALLEYKAVHNLGYLEFLRGNLPAALRHMAEAGADEDRPVATPLLDRARVLIEAGLLTEADRALAGAIEILARDRMTQEVAESQLLRSQCALALGEPRLARAHARRARTRFARRGNRNWELLADLQLLQIQLLTGPVRPAQVDQAHRLQADLRRIGMSVPARSAALVAAEAALRSRDSGTADSRTGAPVPVPRLRKDDSIALRVHGQAVRAEAALRAGAPSLARRHLRAGLRELAGFRASFGSIELQVASAVHGTRLTELDLRIALRQRQPAQVFAAVERARAVSTRIRTVTPKSEQSTADLLADLRLATEQLRELPLEASSRPRAAVLRGRIAELQDRLRMQRWLTEGSGDAVQPATLAAVRAALTADGASLVSFVQADGALLALRVDPDGSRVLELGPAAGLAERARRLRSDLDVAALTGLAPALVDTIRRSVTSSLAELTRLLSPALSPAAGRLVVVPVGELWGVPWNALAPLHGVPVTVAPSASSSLANRAPAAGRSGEPVVYGVSGPGLSRAEQEVLDLRLAWPDARLAPRAGRSDLLAGLERASILHIAAHGAHHPESPLFSAVQLHDGPMFAYDLDAARATPEHVILSSCELGMNRISAGDEALGLTSVLLRRGARSVVASTVRVSDDRAAEFMIGYHRLLAAGHDSALALAVSAAELGPFPVPFVCFGSSWRRPATT